MQKAKSKQKLKELLEMNRQKKFAEIDAYISNVLTTERVNDLHSVAPVSLDLLRLGTIGTNNPKQRQI